MGLTRGLACNLADLEGVFGSDRPRSEALAPRLRRCGLDLESGPSIGFFTNCTLSSNKTRKAGKLQGESKNPERLLSVAVRAFSADEQSYLQIRRYAANADR